MEKKKEKNQENKHEEFGPELSPDDLDFREDNDLTEEQYKNSNHEKQLNDSKTNKL